MRKFALFLAALAAVDRVIGFGMDALYRRSLAGEMGGLINLALSRDAELLVLGSSRAQHHLAPKILGRALGRKAFNAGVDGQDFLYAMMLFDLWTERHGAPRMVLLQVDPMSFRRSPDELGRASVFAPFVDRSALVRDVLYSRSRWDRLKYLSSSYRYNGKVFAVLKNAMRRPEPGFDGFVGIPPDPNAGDAGAIDAALRLSDSNEPFWDRKLALFDRLDAYCRAHGTKLVLVRSPHYAPDSDSERRWLGEMRGLLARHPAVVFLDAAALYSASFRGRPELFKDAYHLNASGAELFSTLLAQELAGPKSEAERPR
jgi:hypothetical protein